MAATVIIGRIEDAFGGVLRLSAPGVQDNVYALDIGSLANPPAAGHPVWRIQVLIDDRFEGVDYGADSIIELSKGPDVVYARGGVDLIKSGLGDDAVDAGANDDIVFAGGGRDLVRGGRGEDWISGGWHDDLLFGDQDDDLILGNRGADQLRGGAGDDSLVGQLGDDLMMGSVGEDELQGGQGDDEMHGGPDADVMLGGAGDDELHGGVGNDMLVGGAGADQFRVLLSDQDRVLDFRLEDGDRLFVDHLEVDDPLAWLDGRGEVQAPQPEQPEEEPENQDDPGEEEPGEEEPEEPGEEEPVEEGPGDQDDGGEGAAEDEGGGLLLDLASVLADDVRIFDDVAAGRGPAPAAGQLALSIAAAPDPLPGAPEVMASDGATS